MAGAPRQQRVFKPNELADEAEVEQLETLPQPAPEEPTGLSAEEQQGAEQPAEQKHEETVSYDRFRELNEANKRLERELAEHQEFRTRLDERQRLIKEQHEQNERRAAIQRQASERPDQTIDPVGAELYDQRQRSVQYETQIRQLQEQLNNFGQNYQNNQEQQQFTNWVQQEANTYHQTDPQYFNAAKYAADKRINFWRQVAPNAPPDLPQRMVEAESLLIARLAQQYGGRFAPVVAQLAKDWGFNPQPPQQGQNGNVRQLPVRQPNVQQQRLEQVRNGQRVQGLGGVPAGNNNQGAGSAYRSYSAADIANMPEREFMQAMANPQTAADLRYAMARAEGLGETEEVNW